MTTRFLSLHVVHPALRATMAFVLGLLMSTLAAVTTARSATLDDVVKLLAADSFSDTDAAISALTTSGHPAAVPILEAMSDRRLLVDRKANKLVISTGAARTDAATGAPVTGAADDATVVRLNNRLRGRIEAALASLSFANPDPAKRLAAVEQIAKARNIAALPRIEEALKSEKNTDVREALTIARATLVLSDDKATSTDKISAIADLVGRYDPDTMTTLRTASQSAAPDVKQAAMTAIASAERRQQFANVVQNFWYGLSLGSLLLLASAGLAITFGVMGVINMAHGEMVMIGAYTTYVVQETLRSVAPGAVDSALLISIPLAFLVAGAIGVAIERGIIRFLYGRPLETLLATWGVSLILQQAIRVWFGASNVQVQTPSYMSGSFDLFGLSITYGRLWILVFTLLAFLALLAVMKLTPLGLQMRAVTQNRRMAAAMGIRTSTVDALTFGLGCGVAGVAGVALSQIDNVAPNLGQSYIVDCFMVVVFGGVGNLWGTFVSAFSLGIANKFLEPVAGAVLGKIAILVLLIIFIQKRPRGLFALKGRAVEA
ncbi:MAG TPA: urea ABC transporter permease subunit UrtB [Hyphomicrobiaceae bacterium]|nr:urea ABC transporter permease subunit UrtB [Hyphomicrobiaceae bacterium]